MKNKFYKSRNLRKYVGTITTQQFEALASLPPRKLIDYLHDRWDHKFRVKIYEYDDGMYVGYGNLYALVNEPTADRIRGLLNYIKENEVK